MKGNTGNNKSIEMTSHSNRAECSFQKWPHSISGLQCSCWNMHGAVQMNGMHRIHCAQFPVWSPKQRMWQRRSFQCLCLQGTYSPIAAKQLENPIGVFRLSSEMHSHHTWGWEWKQQVSVGGALDAELGATPAMTASLWVWIPQAEILPAILVALKGRAFGVWLGPEGGTQGWVWWPQ